MTAQIENLSSLKRLIDQNFDEIDKAIDRTSGQAGLAAGAVGPSKSVSKVNLRGSGISRSTRHRRRSRRA